MQTLLLPAINLGILVAVLAYYLRQPAKDFVRNRHLVLKQEVERIAEQLRVSQERFEEFSSKLKAIDVELTALREQTQQDAEVMRNKVLNDARKLSLSIVADAQTAAE